MAPVFAERGVGNGRDRGPAGGALASNPFRTALIFLGTNYLELLIVWEIIFSTERDFMVCVLLPLRVYSVRQALLAE